MSSLFRLQLGWQGESFWILNFLLGDKWAPDGISGPKHVFGLGDNPRNHNGILSPYGRVKWNLREPSAPVSKLEHGTWRQGLSICCHIGSFLGSSVVMIASSVC